MMSTLSPVPASLPQESQVIHGKAYRHNPYAFKLLNEKDRNSAVMSFLALYNNLNTDGQLQMLKKVQDTMEPRSSNCSTYSSACPSPAPQLLDAEDVEAGAKSAAADSGNDDGVSETSSDYGSGDHSNGVAVATAAAAAKEGLVDFAVTGSHLLPFDALPGSAASVVAPTVIRYASVNFRFGSAWFVAPFRTFAGDMVVVQYPGNNNSVHMGLVSGITTAKPITFYTEDNMDSNYLSPEELQTAPRLLRHARDFDKEAKLDLRNHDLRSLVNARRLAEEMGAPIQFLDAEWLLDLSAVTFLVNVFAKDELADQLVDELAFQEGAEVVFTYPVSASMY
ncbi:hypothetical protein ABB37_03912 [Leptomonas pyrrhocoris]|uniref:Uncharacterized protein n=1 Tax=Leptomonas pyrrhocoris TaxID=157538 RepID=A0A0M9G3M8_LEPPY|nr:hypothetical protein ABB37_03912 [Leptomonas pyrrhocoris]KPA81573.1 hypothetical protein ABB37_03912 [Leptomonas pyrrhocoris]|eukprot:XP_015660012.1 hypothetical protein ABB37_03912 [Leptomonas pyrrhocoris]